MTVIAIDLGGTKSAAAVITPSGTILKSQKTTIAGKSGADVSLMIQNQIRTLMEFAAKNGPSVSAIGVSVPGIYYSKTGHVWAPNIPGWTDYPLKKDLQKYFPDVPVKIDSDRAAYILGETWLGAARGCQNAIFIAVGTGIGAGILIDGKILRGHGDIAGATGWMALHPTFRDEYTRYGCFEYHASGDGLARVARDLLKTNNNYDGFLRNLNPEQISSYDVFTACNDGDSLAEQVIRQAVRYWGMATANYISLFNPEMIVFGGGVFGPAADLIPQIRTEAKRWAQPIAFKQVKIVLSKNGDHAGLFGAAKIALSAAT